MNQFEWTLPVSGQKIVWRPLKIGDHMDLDANYGASNMAHLKRYAQVSSRIISIDGKTKNEMSKDDLAIVKDWDEYDFIAFHEEVESRELARQVALAPQRPGGVVQTLEQAVTKVQQVLGELGPALTIALQKFKEAEQKTGPLK